MNEKNCMQLTGLEQFLELECDDGDFLIFHHHGDVYTLSNLNKNRAVSWGDETNERMKILKAKADEGI